MLAQRWPWLVVSAVFLIVDQWTKYLANQHLVLYQPQAFLPYFNFTLLHNEGAAFGVFSNAGGWQRWFLGAIAVGVSAFLIYAIVRMRQLSREDVIGFSFILAGAIGNLLDRMIHGYVIDFVDWFYQSSGNCLPFFYARPLDQTCHWPAFNIADMSILLGFVFVLMGTFLVKEQEPVKKQKLADKTESVDQDSK